MTKMQKIGLIFLVIVTFSYIKVAFFPSLKIVPEFLTKKEIQQENVEQKESEELKEEEKEVLPKMFVNIYFIGQNKNHDEVYKIVKREYNPEKESSKIKFAISTLLNGPTATERKTKIYTEIPRTTKLLSIKEEPDKITIDLSSDFDQGGGTDGLYKRLYQLIKTANRNTNKDVFLKINGVQAEVIGGEGIMINQPLNNNSLGE